MKLEPYHPVCVATLVLLLHFAACRYSWPAVLSQPDPAQHDVRDVNHQINSGHIFVFFFAENTFEWVLPNQIKPYDEFLGQPKGIDKRRKLAKRWKHAMEKAGQLRAQYGCPDNISFPIPRLQLRKCLQLSPLLHHCSFDAPSQIQELIPGPESPEFSAYFECLRDHGGSSDARDLGAVAHDQTLEKTICNLSPSALQLILEDFGSQQLDPIRELGITSSH